MRSIALKRFCPVVIGVLVLYGMGAASVLAQASFQPGEAAAWREAQAQATAGGYAVYLDRFPQGVHARTAFRNLIALEQGLLPAGPDERVEPRATGLEGADAETFDRY